MGAHFKKQEIWPFGQGYYASLKNIKNYGFNYKEILAEEAKKAVNIIDLACFDRSLILNSIS